MGYRGCKNDTNGALGANGPPFNVLFFFFGSISKEDEGMVESDSCSAVECRLVFSNELDGAARLHFLH